MLKTLLNAIMIIFGTKTPETEETKPEENSMKYIDKYKLGNNSLRVLGTVHPDLQKVVKTAIRLTEVDFTVTQGKRTYEEQAALYGKGRTAEELAAVGVPATYARPSEKRVTWTMKSNHMTGRAVDLAPFVNGKIEWDDNGRLVLWPRLNAAMQEAAKINGVKIAWGGNWTTNIDRPHWELA